MKKLLLIDGSSLVHRAFYALPPMNAPDGTPTNAVYGLASMLLRLLSETQPDYIVAAFDKSRITFRNEIFTEYKAHRKSTPEELSVQFPLVQQLLVLMGVTVVELAGYEADDIIGTYAHLAEVAGDQAIIVTGDRDALQLVSPTTEVWLTKKGISETCKVTADNISELFGVSAKGVIELKALMGDSSDNIPGVPGVGEKTALKLLQQYQSLDGVYAHQDEITGKLGERLRENQDIAYMSRKLATIDVHVEGLTEYQCPALQGNKRELDGFCERIALRALKNRLLEVVAGVEVPAAVVTKRSVPYKSIHSISELQALHLAGQIALCYTCDSSEGLFGDTLIAIAAEQEVYLLRGSGQEEVLAALGAADAIIVCDAKRIMTQRAIEDYADKLEDIQLLAYVIDPDSGRSTLQQLQEHYLADWEYDWASSDAAGGIVTQVRALYDLMPELKRAAQTSGVWQLCTEVELPLCFVLAKMERVGIKVDLDKARLLQKEFSLRLVALTKEICAYAGQDFNINSPKQLGEVLFEKLNLPAAKKTKSGYSTDNEVLQSLQAAHPIVDCILEYRMLAKLNSTYLEAFKNMADPRDGRIHTTFNQNITATGRLSSSDPNLQNIPIKTQFGRMIRALFVPSVGYDYLLSADYSQIELRILAHLSNCQSLIQAFARNLDVHRVTAAEVFNTTPDEVTDSERQRAKAVNFGIVYGQSDYGLARGINVTRKEAGEYIRRYFERYHEVKEFIDKAIADARREGYSKTMFNRIRYIRDINSPNYNIRSFAERMAVNTPVQGAAADIIKIAMLAVDRQLRARALKSRVLLQVHDELVLEVTQDERFEVELLVQSTMENAAHLSVPLTVEVNCGSNWSTAK